MKTKSPEILNDHQHVSAPGSPAVPPEPLSPESGLALSFAAAAADFDATASDPSRKLLPPSVRERRFRAHSFAAKLNPVQRHTLLAWLRTFTLEEVRAKVAAPPP